MARSTQLRMVLLKVPQIVLAFGGLLHWPSEKNQLSLEKSSKSLEKAKVPKLKTNEEHVKELTLGQEMLEQTIKKMERECVAATASLKVREEQLWAKHMECEDLRLNLAKEKELRAEEELRTKGLREEAMTMKTDRMELWGRIGACTEDHNKEMQHANELMASLE
ncbi:hypothetical protein AXG93_4202s1000 [Marchantia polymorpha subsp. ruderalis]|uniref:Uncharacterized protein n=1 Tax=Marchantia polymorpha subsp. ruderalis TaxID=1480154 RepID=A0A176WFS3_MARPO|nr:hypothetical protein AXG93_4202s1000 [Marchantia polymorpha subsp. ruderalis]